MSRRHEISRLEAFSDAVFAFALTLLVVSLDVPTSYAQLKQLMAGFVPFAASFALLTWIWYEHNKFFRRFGLQDPWTVTLNSVLLFVVLFYVYPLKFLFSTAFANFIPALGVRMDITPRQVGSLFVIYGCGFVALFGMLALLYRHAYRKRVELGLDALEIFDARAGAGSHVVSMAVGVVSIACALAPFPFPMFSGFAYFFMGPAHWLYAVRASRRRAALEAQLARPGTVVT